MILFPQETWKPIVEQLNNAKHVMLTTHCNSDADGIGSELALFHTLQGMGIQVSMLNRDVVPRICQYLPGSKLIQVTESPDVSTVDTIVALDAGAKSRLGFPDDLFAGKILINIDHHASNPLYGDLNVVNADYCATGAMVFDLIQHLGQSLSQRSAISIYAAILTDTASFQLDRVNADVHRMTAELIDAGAKPEEAANAIYNSQPLARLSLLTLALQTLSIQHDGRSAWMHVTQAMQDETGANHEDSEGFIDHGRTIQGVEVVVFIRPEKDGRWKVSFRAKARRNVGEVAAKLGGGGHQYAAGCAVSGSLEEVYAKVEAVVSCFFKI
ncbi:MAG: bifunctional oligoribonuclease/PAP phosphatase NrnA [Ghiorsea sp.]|nr:bifunctional oligoribonuclease/PAP phosphatase NrnA [Ghiorsea sp.]